VHSFLCYDSAAADHDRLAVPAVFAEPARELVARTGLPAAGRILDIGTGTGIAARLAIELAHPGTIVVGLDPSLESFAWPEATICYASPWAPHPAYPIRTRLSIWFLRISYLVI